MLKRQENNVEKMVPTIRTFLLLALQAVDDRVKQVAEVLARRPRGPGAPGPPLNLGI